MKFANKPTSSLMVFLCALMVQSTVVFGQAASIPLHGGEGKRLKTEQLTYVLRDFDDILWRAIQKGSIDDSMFKNQWDKVNLRWNALAKTIPPKVAEPVSKTLESAFKSLTLETKGSSAFPLEVIGPWHNILRGNILKQLELVLGPTETPLKENGKRLYEKHCASCHGDKGVGDGVLAKRLGKNLSDYTQAKNQRYVSPAMILHYMKGDKEKNPQRLMPTYEEVLSTNEHWDVSFYFKTFLKTDSQVTNKHPPQNFSLNDLALKSDQDMMVQGTTSQDLYELRFILPFKKETERR